MYFSRATVLAAIVALAYAQTPAAAVAENAAAATPSMAAGGMAGGEMKGGMNSTQPKGGDMKGGMGAGAGAAGAAAEGMTKTHVVQVGGTNGSLVFLPADIQAAAGDLVQFQFHPKVILVR